MPRRLFALVLMLATMASPLSLALCRVECATASASGGRTSAVHHSCHEQAAPVVIQITAGAHACGHASDVSAEQALQTLATPVAVVPAAIWASPPVVTQAVAPDVQHSPPVFFQLVSQLRV